uniref:Uncharacterized protein n=1 Tax=Vespula pensylvanica TaxID=30213 RepID=A0A834KRJ4_VESPE|nr:hypothetical protein H0235_012615 [Vespula pensylvanica]
MTSLVQRDFGSPRKRESTGSNASSYLLLLNSLATDLDCMLSELCTTPDSYERLITFARETVKHIRDNNSGRSRDICKALYKGDTKSLNSREERRENLHAISPRYTH